MKRNFFNIKEARSYETLNEQIEREKDRFFWKMQGLH